jgi:hypothetical protein
MVNNGRKYPRYRRAGRFFGRRVNCEQVPLLPAWAAWRVLDDPRKIPYLFVWKSRRDGAVQDVVRVTAEAVRSAANGTLPVDLTGWIEIKRPDGACTFIRIAAHSLPRNGGKVRLLVCPRCQAPRRALYGWVPRGRFTNSVQTSHWQCRACAGLRYSSEGGALVIRGGTVSRLLRLPFPDLSSPRPAPWLPYVFTSIEQAMEEVVGIEVGS